MTIQASWPANECSETSIRAGLTELAKVAPQSVVEVFTSFGVWEHFRSLNRGLFRVQDMVWFASIIFISLLGTSAILSAKRA